MFSGCYKFFFSGAGGILKGEANSTGVTVPKDQKVKAATFIKTDGTIVKSQSPTVGFSVNTNGNSGKQ